MMVKERLGNQVMYADSAYIEPELSKLSLHGERAILSWNGPENFQSV